MCLQATSKPPGMTGTGAPVTERLRCGFCRELGWYREYIILAPIVGGEVFIFVIICGGNSNESKTLRSKRTPGNVPVFL